MFVVPIKLRIFHVYPYKWYGLKMDRIFTRTALKKWIFYWDLKHSIKIIVVASITECKPWCKGM